MDFEENIVHITVFGAFSKIEGDAPWKEVYTACSYKAAGVEYSKAYRRGVWDGITYLINKKTSSFPSGLVNIVKKVCEDEGKEVFIHDHRKDPGSMAVYSKGSLDLKDVSMTGKYSYQLEGCKAAIEHKRGILNLCTGCHRKGQRILKFDGSIVNVEDIKVGDLLMGPDSNPRTVLRLIRNTGKMCEVIPIKGEPFVVNEDHVLTLVSTPRTKIPKYPSDKGGRVVDVSIKKWKTWSASKKHLFKLFKPEKIEFGNKKEKLLIPPYHLGMLLGDGGLSAGSIIVFKPDIEIKKACEDLAKIFNLKINLVDKESSGIGYSIVGSKGKNNPLISELRRLGLYKTTSHTKFIPESYLFSSYNDRLELLAGLLDTDGSYNGKGFDYITASKKLSENLEFLCRSLGFSCYFKKCNKSCQNDFVGEYYRGYTGGSVGDIPTRIPRKQACSPSHRKNVLRVGFRIKDLDLEEDYYGFTLDGDGRYLLGDFIVTHNSGKTYLSAALINYYQLPTLYVLPSKELLYQTRKVFLDHIPNVTEKEIGIVGDGKWEPGTWVTVAIIDTLESRYNSKECQDLLNNTDLLFGDEIHYAASESWYDVLVSCNAYYKFGLSGTPLDRTDGANLKVLALFGEIIHTVRNKQLVEAKVLPKAKIVFDTVAKPSLIGSKLKYNTVYDEGVVNNKYLTEKIVQWTKICVDQGLSVLIMVEHVKHGKLIDEALWNIEGSFIPHTFISGQPDDKKNRKEGFEAFDRREIPVLVATNIMNTGISSKAIDVLIPIYRKSKIRTIQGLGRTLRGDKAIVIEFANYCHKFLLEHSLARLRDYKAEDCFDIVQSGPDIDLIKRLWAGASK